MAIKRSFFICCMTLLSACGGSTAIHEMLGLATLSGMAAGGAAIVGEVQVTDSLGVELPQPVVIDTDGNYTANVAGMKAPFIIQATGMVGNNPVNYFSIAVLEDVGRTVNVTPFTDLMVRHISAQMSDDCFAFELKPCARLTDKLTPASIAKAQNDVQAILQPALAGMNLSQVDLLRGSFKADHQDLDAILDLVKVERSGRQLILKNARDQTTLTVIDPGVPASLSEPLKNLNVASINQSAADLQSIQNVVKSLEQLYAAKAPTRADILASSAFDTARFLDAGEDFEHWVPSMTGQVGWIGLKVKNIHIEFDKDAPNTKAMVVFNLLGPSGSFSESMETAVWKDNGTWQMVGDQKMVDVDFHARADFHQDTQLFTSGFNFSVQADKFNVRQALVSRVASAEVSGPGLRTASGASATLVMRMTPPYNTLETHEVTECLPGNAASVCVLLSAVSPNAEYTLVLKNSSGASLNGSGYKIKIPAVPLATASLKPEQFQRIDHIEVASVLNNPALFKPNTTLSVSYTNASALKPTGIDVYPSAESGYAYARLQGQVTDPKATRLNFPWTDEVYPEVVNSLGVNARGKDAALRHFYTWRRFQSTAPVGSSTYVLGPDILPANFYIRDSSVPEGWWSVDDDVTVSLNGVPIFQDADIATNALPPFVFQAKTGDVLRIVAKDTAGTCHYVTPLKVTKSVSAVPLAGTSVPQVCDGAAPSNDAYVDLTFTLTSDVSDLATFVLGPDALPSGFYIIPSLTRPGWWSADDDVTVYLNGNVIFEDINQLTDEFPPVIFQARAGDRLRIVAKDTAGSCHYLTPLKVSRPAVAMSLTGSSVPQVCDQGSPSTVPYLDRSYTLP